MREQLRRVSMAVVLAVMLLAALVPLAQADGEVTWYWRDTDASGFSYPAGHACDKVMQQGDWGGADQFITLEPGKRAWWYIDVAAGSDSAFPAGDWLVTYWVKALNDVDKDRQIQTKLYVVDAGGTAASQWGKTPKVLNPGTIEMISTLKTGASSVTVPQNGRLAVEIYWVSTATGNLEIYYNSSSHNSRVVSPAASPSWPTPELSSFLLFSAGVLALAGYVWARSRRACRIS